MLVCMFCLERVARPQPNFPWRSAASQRQPATSWGLMTQGVGQHLHHHHFTPVPTCYTPLQERLHFGTKQTLGRAGVANFRQQVQHTHTSVERLGNTWSTVDWGRTATTACYYVSQHPPLSGTQGRCPILPPLARYTPGGATFCARWTKTLTQYKTHEITQDNPVSVEHVVTLGFCRICTCASLPHSLDLFFFKLLPLCKYFPFFPVSQLCLFSNTYLGVHFNCV